MQTKQLSFIPLEKEIDVLIAGCGKKVAASLQLIKETGIRIGEARRLRWIDIDEERRTIRARSLLLYFITYLIITKFKDVERKRVSKGSSLWS